MSCACLSVKTFVGTECAGFSVCAHDGREPEFIALAEFLPRVRLVAKGVPEEVALEFLNEAALAFARQSGVLKRRLVLDVQKGVRDYYVQAGEHEQIALVRELAYGCGRDWTVSPCAVPERGCRHDLFGFEPPDKVWLKDVPKADKEAAVKLEYAAMPRPDACMADRLLYDRYQDGVVAGALAHVLLMRAYEFADARLAAVYEARFARAVSEAKIDMAEGFTTGSRRLMGFARV